MQGVSHDIEILRIAKFDKQKAFELAFNTFWEPIYRQAYRKVQSEDTAKDLTQEVFIVLWENINNLTGYDKLLPYLYAVLRNKTLKLFEKDAVRLRYAINLSSPENAAESVESSSHQLLVGKELLSVITDEVAKMPPRMKEIYVLKRNSYFSVRDIAEKLCVSEQTVKNQLQSATKRLKSRVKDYDPSLVMMILTLAEIFLKN